MIRTHKISGWQRESIGFSRWRITPTDDSGVREVEFLSAGTWQNLPNDDKARSGDDRVVLISGDPLPQWAVEWLEKANAQSCERARDRFRAMCDQADWDQASREGW